MRWIVQKTWRFAATMTAVMVAQASSARRGVHSLMALSGIQTSVMALSGIQTATNRSALTTTMSHALRWSVTTTRNIRERHENVDACSHSTPDTNRSHVLNALMYVSAWGRDRNVRWQRVVTSKALM